MKDENPRSPRRGRANQILWTRIGLVLCLGASLVFSIGAILSQPHIVRLRSFDPLAVGKARVEATAQELARAWHPSDKAEVAQRLRSSQDLARFRLALRESLRQQHGKARERLVACAGIVGGSEVRCEVANIAAAGSGTAQVSAIEVAHRIRPWSRDELGDFLANKDQRVRVGTLETVARLGGELPPEALLACLVSDDRSEREAAVRAVPRHPSAELRSELERLLQHGDSRATAQAIAALSRCACANEYEEQVLACLGTRDDDVRRAALVFLGELGRAPAQPDRVWAVAVDTLQTPAVRALALQCLERTGSVDLDALRAQAPMMTPVERLLAARCLIRASDALAVDVLIELLARECPSQVAESCRRHLAWLTGAAASSSGEQFRAAFDRSGRRLRTRHLPALGFDIE